MTLRVVDETIESFMEKHGLDKLDHGECINCKNPVKYTDLFYSAGYAALRFIHECPREYWVTMMIPISKKEKEYWSKQLGN